MVWGRQPTPPKGRTPTVRSNPPKARPPRPAGARARAGHAGGLIKHTEKAGFDRLKKSKNPSVRKAAAVAKTASKKANTQRSKRMT